MKKIKYSVIMFLLLTACSGSYINYKHLDFELNKTTKKDIIKSLKLMKDKVKPINHNIFGNDRYEVVYKMSDFITSNSVFQYYLLRNDTLVYFGYPYQFQSNINDTIRIAGEETTKLLIDLEDLEK